MSWHYSAVQVGDFSLPTYLDSLRSARAKSNRSVETLSCNGNETAFYQLSLFGTMCERSTGDLGVGLSMSSQEDSPVKTYQRQVKVKDLPERVVASGSKCYESLKRFGLTMSSRKTVRTCVPVALAPSSKDLPAWGMTYDGACWELGTRVHLTNETECGSWLATPTAKANQMSPSMSKWPSCRAWLPTPTAAQYGTNTAIGGHPRPSLASMARHQTWPTPTVQDAKNNGGPSQMKRNTKPLNARVGGKLNPTWVEWLMNWPLHWTERSAFGQLEMDRFRLWLHSHGK